MQTKRHTLIVLSLTGLLTTSIAIAATDTYSDSDKTQKKSKNVKSTHRHIDYASLLLQPFKEELGRAKRNIGDAIEQAF